MFKHFLKIAYRNLLRRKIYSIINVTGLAVGMACCLLITYYVYHELSYDRYHEKADRIFRVIHTFRNIPANETVPPPSPEEFQVWGNAPVAPALKNDFPEIEKIAQFTSHNSLLLQYGNKRFQEENILFMDSTAFDIFTWKMIAGNPHTALVAPNSIVLTESVAKKYFGRENPVGKTITAENSQPFRVTGVMEDVPSNSHFTFNALVSMTTFRSWREDIFNYWGYVDFYTYFLLKENADIKTIQARIPAFLKMRNPERGYTIRFEKLGDAYLHSVAGRQPGPTGNLSNVYIFSVVALFILAIACINFMNLATARSMERAKEVGVRKVLGAQHRGLVRQFLSESIVLTLIAVILALILAQIALPVIGELSGKNFYSKSVFSWDVLLIAISCAVIVGLLSGIYPALFLSRFRTITVLKGVYQTNARGVNLRKALVVFQFTLSMALIAGTGIVYSQLQHLRHHDLGFKQDQMLVIDFGSDQTLQKKLATIKKILLDHPQVVSVSTSRAVPGEFLPNAHTEIQSAKGDMIGLGPLIYEIDEDFIPNYQIEMVAGRNYSREFPADSLSSLIINEATARLFGYTDPHAVIGKKFSQWGREGTVIGVVKDFNFRSLHRPVEPLTLRFGYPESFGRLSLRLKPDNIKGTIGDLKKVWDRIAPERPFLYTFQDESFARQYASDVNFGQVFTLFSGLAVFIACLGLFGLATFTAEQRTKEIGIRKVLGSSVAGIVTLISKDFIRLVVIAIVLAIPLAWYSMNKWLEDFSYRITISPLIFLKAGLIAIVIALITISWQSVKAATMNPVKSLRNE